MDVQVSDRASGFTESVIREMTRLVNEKHPADGINLAQGFPDFPAPQIVKDAACRAVTEDLNQYALTWGAKSFREAIARKTERFLGTPVDPETDVTVTCGATEAMAATMLALVNPGDEIIVFEPFYENYGPDCALCGATPRFVRLRPPAWDIDIDGLVSSFGPKTRAIVVNTPNNPTGKVFSQEELELIADLCRRWDCLAFTDEIYEHMVYDGGTHISLSTLPGMRERTVVINGLSKTYSVTGWRVGYAIAPRHLTSSIRKVHDFLTVGAAAPLQAAGVTAMSMPDEYYEQLCRDYAERRDFLLDVLRDSGFAPSVPAGAYYIMADISGLTYLPDVEFAAWMVDELGVAVVPGSSFFSDPSVGAPYVRFAFPKQLQTLRKVAPRLTSIRMDARIRA